MKTNEGEEWVVYQDRVQMRELFCGYDECGASGPLNLTLKDLHDMTEAIHREAKRAWCSKCQNSVSELDDCRQYNQNCGIYLGGMG